MTVDEMAILERFRVNGELRSYKLLNLGDDGKLGKTESRNTQRLVLIFPSGDRFCVDTFCSGCAENTSLIISEEKD